LAYLIQQFIRPGRFMGHRILRNYAYTTSESPTSNGRLDHQTLLKALSEYPDNDDEILESWDTRARLWSGVGPWVLSSIGSTDSWNKPYTQLIDADSSRHPLYWGEDFVEREYWEELLEWEAFKKGMLQWKRRNYNTTPAVQSQEEV
jgi:hypothetical protein